MKRQPPEADFRLLARPALDAFLSDRYYASHCLVMVGSGGVAFRGPPGQTSYTACKNPPEQKLLLRVPCTYRRMFPVHHRDMK